MAGESDANKITTKELLNLYGYNKSTVATHGDILKTGDSLDSSKQDLLVSGQNIKTINGESVLGEGDLPVTGGLSQQQVEGLI
jgi:hypothetical protein